VSADALSWWIVGTTLAAHVAEDATMLALLGGAFVYEAETVREYRGRCVHWARTSDSGGEWANEVRITWVCAAETLKAAAAIEGRLRQLVAPQDGDVVERDGHQIACQFDVGGALPSDAKGLRLLFISARYSHPREEVE
jgi:hypothetical protein